MPEQVLLALSAFSDMETANNIARTLVAEKFVACANIIPAVHSIYRWRGKVEAGGEVLVFFKTTRDRQKAFQDKLRSLHPYELPEIIYLKIDKGSPDYLRWVAENCAS
jgi:periplasmic divalent cation tolerance protein